MQEVSEVYNSPFLDTDGLKVALRDWTRLASTIHGLTFRGDDKKKFTTETGRPRI